MDRVPTWYLIGVALGLAAGLGVLAAAVVAPRGAGALVAAAAAALAAAAVAYLLAGWPEVAAGALGGALGALGAAPLASGALRRGGTRGGTATLLAAAAVVLGLLALIPVVGYLEAIAVPALGARLRRRAPDRYAGLRSLARD